MSPISFFIAHSELAAKILGLGAVAFLGGTIFTINSQDESSHLFGEVPAGEEGRWSEAMDGKHFDEIPKVPHSYRDLLNGTKKYRSGNYVIYYGSEACPHCTGMLFGDLALSAGNLDLNRDKMSDGAWMKAYHYTRVEKNLKEKDIGFIMFEDIPDSTVPNYTDRQWTLPWATDPKTHKPLRNDRSSRDFRKLFQAAKDRFGDRVPGTPTVIVYRDGVPKVFNRDELPGYRSIKQDESLSNVDELKRFIRYYYLSLESA